MYSLVGLISFVVWIYLLINSFGKGCLWPILLFFFAPITVAIYAVTQFEGNKTAVLVGFYLPLILSIASELLK